MAEGQTPPAFEAAFNRLKQTVTPHDAIRFQSTTLEDVWKSARDIERVQKQRQSLRNLARIKPLLDGLEKYSKTIEVLCNGTPFLPWVWAPIKYLLQIASSYGHIFDLLIGAYAQIAEALPRFDRFQILFDHDPNFRIVLAMVYTDILEFHQYAYKIFKRPAWYIIFGSLWKNFESRFTQILESLARHRELVDREAVSIDIAEARSWRVRSEEDIERREKQRKEQQLHYAIGWLDIDDLLQEEEVDRLSSQRQDRTCEWAMKNPEVKAWIEGSHKENLIWLNGIPGAGKSVLVSHIISTLKADQKTTTLYYFCDSHHGIRDLCGAIFRTLALQLIRANVDLASYVSDDYAARGLTCSMTQLKELLLNLLKASSNTIIILDGLDECEDKCQKQILQEVMKLGGEHCKILISSREGGHISKTLRKRKTLALKDQKNEIDRDIRLYATQTLAGLREKFADDIVKEIQQRVVEKADGMFLWVRLVIDSLLDCDSISELREAVTQLPDGLDAAYDRILRRIEKTHNQSISQKAVRILEWVACSRRTLKNYEIQDGIVFTSDNAVLDETTKQLPSIFELCKPIIEEGPGNTIDFVHYSAKEYADPTPFLEAPKTPIAKITQDIYLINLVLIDPTCTPNNARTRVLQGYHGLHHYADEFWIDHLLQYFKLKGSFDKVLLVALERALQFQKYNLLQNNNAKFAKNTLPLSLHKRFELISAMSGVPELRSFIQKILLFRTHSALNENGTGMSQKENLELKMTNDPSWFTKVSHHYQEIVGFLLSEAAVSSGELDAHSLSEFRKTYGPTAFVCDFYQCARASNGFISANARDEHRALHILQFYCPESKCIYSSSGFSKPNLLQKHIQHHHSKPDDPVPLLSKQRAPKKRRFNDPEDYTFAPAFLTIPYDPDVLRRRLREATDRHISNGYDISLDEPDLSPEFKIESYNSITDHFYKESKHLEDRMSRPSHIGDESSSHQELELEFLSSQGSSQGSPQFPTGPSSRILPPKKALLDYEHATSKWRNLSDAKVDLEAWKNIQTGITQISKHWTIPELCSFPELLKNFGSDWKGIAGVIKTKTALMVMKHYESQVEPGKTEYERLVIEANALIAVGNGKETDLGTMVKEQPQRLYDPYSLSNITRKPNTQNSTLDVHTNELFSTKRPLDWSKETEEEPESLSPLDVQMYQLLEEEEHPTYYDDIKRAL